MKLIMNVEITEGYEKWKKLFLSVDAQREKYGVKVLAYGHPKDNENKIYQVLEIESMERMQEGLADPVLAKLRTDAGVKLDTQELVFLVE
mgnify:FL=1|tara:strand:- start:7 stop:276 length:270 start_codon:yes stop_codon:yes gene_type:complete